jgi:hypothetical protein
MDCLAAPVAHSATLLLEKASAAEGSQAKGGAKSAIRSR